MVGNDVVDLQDRSTRSEALHRRFDARVMSPRERDRLDAAGEPRQLRWTLWAAKESAFKLAKRRDRRVIFAHSRFETDLDEDGHGTVRLDDWSCTVSVRREGSALHCIAAPGSVGGIVSRVDRLAPGIAPSDGVRQLAIATLARHLGIEPTALRITSNQDRIPHLSVSGHRLGHLSLSHHGEFVAFAWSRR
jgi:phosphopantetheinyl transferase (holo-ACP synthase)